MTKQTKSRPTSKKTTANKSKKGVYSKSINRKWLIAAPIIVLIIVGAFGVWKTYFSKATTALSSEQCYLRGRVRNSSGDCTKSCLSGAGTLQYGTYYDWCSKAISTGLSPTTCSSKGRDYVASTGCARFWGQYTLYHAKQCKDNSATYKIASVDYCSGSSGGSTGTSGTYVSPIAKPTHLGAGWLYYSSNRNQYHPAQDFGAELNSDVRAAHDGKVVASYNDSSCGRFVIISIAGTSKYFAYEHLNTTGAVASGTNVSAGQKIGTVGYYGNGPCGTFTHVHISLENQSSVTYWGSKTYVTGRTSNPCGVLPNC